MHGTRAGRLAEIRELKAERDALRAQVARLVEALRDLQSHEAVHGCDINVEWIEKLLADIIKEQTDIGRVSNIVACVNCKKPVHVTALNAIRCDECSKLFLGERSG